MTASDGRPLYFEGTITDITQRKAAERALFNEKERAQVTLQSIGDAVVTTDARGNIEYLNPVAEQLTGWESREAQGLPIESIISLTDETTGEAVANPVSRCLQEGRVVTLADNVVLVARDGSSIAIQDSAAPIQDRNGQVVGAVMVFHDVRQERQLHRRLAYLASHDALTGFINRRELEERLSTVLAAVKAEPGKTAALLYMDLDQFKVVNDTCGHSAGDLLLRQLADVLRARRAEDRRARAARRRRVRRAAARSHAGNGRGHRRVVARSDRGVSLRVARQRAAGRRQHRHRARGGRERDRGDAHERGGRGVLRRQGSRPQPHPRLRGRRRGRAPSRDAVGGAHQQGARRGAFRAVSISRSCRSDGGGRSLAALRAVAADARRARRDRGADGVHPGRRALQLDAEPRSLGHQPHARDARVPRCGRDDAVHARDQPVRHLVERRALPRFRARRAHGRRRRARGDLLRDHGDGGDRESRIA